jgi:putative transposase
LTDLIATAGTVHLHPYLTVDEILSHFGQRKANAQEKYSKFVQAGIGNPSIWDNLKAKSLLGVEGFAEELRHLVTGEQQI